MAAKVFLSHNSLDKLFARRLASTLEASGVQVWIDEAEILPGDSLLGKIELAIDRVDYLIVVLSPHSVSSEWVTREVRMAMHREIAGKRVVVIPVLYQDCKIPGFLRDKVYADFRNETTYEGSVAQILRRLRLEEKTVTVTDKYPMSESEVKVIKCGYAQWIAPTQQRADGTITLIKGSTNVIVDTGGPWDKQAILKALRREGIHPADITYVICTHGHSDHTGNNNLFPNATLILSYDVCQGDLYTFHDFAHDQPYRVDDQIEVIPTPGHTTQDISVIVKTKQGVIAVVGDLFECAEDRENESLWRPFSEMPEKQKANRELVLHYSSIDG